MKLLDDWRTELNRLWTVKFAVMGLVISAVDQVLTAFQMFLPPWVYAIGMGLVIAARLMKQKDASASGGA